MTLSTIMFYADWYCVVVWFLTCCVFFISLQYGYLLDPPGVDLQDVETSEIDSEVLKVQY